MKTLLLIDGFAIMHRAYFALPELSTAKGVPTNAVYGFFTMLQKVITDFKPTHIVVALDTPVQTFRKKLYKEYQIQRPEAADGFKQQIPLIKELLDAAGIARLEKEGFEADDVIGTLAKKFRPDFDRVLILTGDRDLLQLVDEKTYVIAPQKGITTSAIYTPEAVKEKYGIEPEKIPDLKALMGDASDNYGGAKGIGPKTAAKLIIEFDNVENVLRKIDTVQPDRIKEIIKNHTEHIILSKRLATILTDLELDIDVNRCLFTVFQPEMEKKLKELELYSLTNRLLHSSLVPKKTIKKVKKEDSEAQAGLF